MTAKACGIAQLVCSAQARANIAEIWNELAAERGAAFADDVVEASAVPREFVMLRNRNHHGAAARFEFVPHEIYFLMRNHHGISSCPSLPPRMVKLVDTNGQISLGKQYAGRQVRVEVQEPGVWLVRTATVIPDNECSLHEARAPSSPRCPQQNSLAEL